MSTDTDEEILDKAPEHDACSLDCIYTICSQLTGDTDLLQRLVHLAEDHSDSHAIGLVQSITEFFVHCSQVEKRVFAEFDVKGALRFPDDLDSTLAETKEIAVALQLENATRESASSTRH